MNATDRASEKKHRYFPMFIDTKGQRVLVIGGGNVARRRVQTLAAFEFEITVIADAVTEEIRRLAESGAVTWIEERWPPTDPNECRSADIILACTDDRQLNRQIGEFCRERGIPVNVCDAREESGFWFPAIALNDELTMGLVGSGEDHNAVRQAAAVLRQVIQERSYER